MTSIYSTTVNPRVVRRARAGALVAIAALIGVLLALAPKPAQAATTLDWVDYVPCVGMLIVQSKDANSPALAAALTTPVLGALCG